MSGRPDSVQVFGQPYLEWPASTRLVTMLVLAVPGALLAAAIAERTVKVA